MGVAMAVASIAATMSLAALALFLLVKMLRTIVELRKVTRGMHDVMRWTLGRIAAEPADHGAVVDGTLAGARKLGPG